jgi:hypothetical protein
MDAYDEYELGASRDTVASAVESMGGLELWEDGQWILADAVVTVYSNDNGEAYVNRQQISLQPLAGRIEATATTPAGRWKAVYERDGRWMLEGGDALRAISPIRLRSTLATMLHRISGPLNLLYGVDEAGETGEAWVEDMDLARVEITRPLATGPQAPARAYYFLEESPTLKLLTAGSDRPGRSGTTSVYTYQMLPNGVIFPSSIRVVKIGQHALLTDEPVLEIRLSNVRFE